MDNISLKALAKINLGLDVVRRRDDGYHEVRMIMQTINLFDRLEIKKIKESAIKIHTNLFFLPVNERYSSPLVLAKGLFYHDRRALMLL